MGIDLSPESRQVLLTFGCYLAGVIALGILSHRYLTRGSFVTEYFLGNRGLGAWVLALTVAATAISGGTFMGFPSYIYTNGWIMALWIASYMVVPLTTMALMGKRINQVARISGSVTVPDVLRDRYQSPALGITATVFLLVFLPFNLVAQFKAGALVMQQAVRLPAAETEFQRAEVEGANLVLHFLAADGTEDTQRTPLPDAKADYLPERTDTVTDGPEKQVRVYFQVGDQEPLSKLVRFPSQKVSLVGSQPIEKGYLVGLIIFALTVVAYTTYGGFWAVTWNDVLQGLVMLIGVILMAVLAVRAVEPFEGHYGLAAATEKLRQQVPPGGSQGSLVYGPGPRNFLPLGAAFSFFLMWSLMAAGQPSGMVRLMSFRDSGSLRKALLLVCGYYLVTYFSLLVIFVCARAIFPTQYLLEVGTEGVPDSIMPVMARYVTARAGVSWLAGLLLAAPYAAIMSTVAAFLLMISSSLVRDLYQRTINPNVSQRTLKVASYLVTGLVGLVVLVGALNPPNYLQDVIVFTGSGQGCSFLFPMLLCLYWRRATREGILASMLGGFFSVFALYAAGWIKTGRFVHLQLGGVDPLVWGLIASLVLGVGVSLATRPDPEQTKKFFP